MEKVHRAPRGLPGCLGLRFPAPLPKAIPPQRSAERRPQPRPGGAALSSAQRHARIPRPTRGPCGKGRALEGRAGRRGKEEGPGGGGGPELGEKEPGEKLSAEAAADFLALPTCRKKPTPGKNRKRNVGTSSGSNASPRHPCDGQRPAERRRSAPGSGEKRSAFWGGSPRPESFSASETFRSAAHAVALPIAQEKNA